MTIETAIPSSAEAVAALFDQLVEAVAQRVLAQLDDKINDRFDDFAREELDGKIDEWAANFLDDRVKEHVSSDDDDLHDQVLEIVQNLSFDIRVSR